MPPAFVNYFSQTPINYHKFAQNQSNLMTPMFQQNQSNPMTPMFQHMMESMMGQMFGTSTTMGVPIDLSQPSHVGQRGAFVDMSQRDDEISEYACKPKKARKKYNITTNSSSEESSDEELALAAIFNTPKKGTTGKSSSPDISPLPAKKSVNNDGDDDHDHDGDEDKDLSQPSHVSDTEEA